MKLVLEVGIFLILLQQVVDGYNQYHSKGLQNVKYSPKYDMKHFDETCNETSSNGIGLINELLRACDSEIPENPSCDKCVPGLTSFMHRPLAAFKHFYDGCHRYCNLIPSDCEMDCPEIYLQILCFYELDQLRKLKKASIESLTLEETETFKDSLRPYHGVCGHGVEPKLKELANREKILKEYRKDCLNDLAKQCETATNDKKTHIGQSCYDGKVPLELKDSLLNNLREFCMWHGFIPRPPNEGHGKVCYDCSNKRVGCTTKKC